MYRLSGLLRLLGVFNLVFVVGALCGPGLVLGLTIYLLVQTPDPTGLALTLVPVLGCGFGVLLIAASLGLLSTIVNQVWTYVKVAPWGIEYRAGWRYGLRAAWADVERIGTYKSLGVISGEVLYLRRAEPIGLQYTQTLRRWLGLSTPLVVALTHISGWPTGGLADDLRHYAPHLFAAPVGGSPPAPGL